MAHPSPTPAWHPGSEPGNKAALKLRSEILEVEKEAAGGTAASVNATTTPVRAMGRRMVIEEVHGSESEGEEEETTVGAHGEQSKSGPAAETAAAATPAAAPPITTAVPVGPSAPEAALPQSPRTSASCPSDVVPPAVLQDKEDAKAAYTSGQYGVARDHYESALATLQGCTKPDAAMRVTLLNNLAACHLKTGECRLCAEVCDQVLELAPTDAKALLRRAT